MLTSLQLSGNGDSFRCIACRMLSLKPGYTAILPMINRRVERLGKWNTRCRRAYVFGLLWYSDNAKDLSLSDHLRPLALLEAHRICAITNASLPPDRNCCSCSPNSLMRRFSTAVLLPRTDFPCAYHFIR